MKHRKTKKIKNNYFFFVTIGPKNELYKQDHSITSPESQNVIKMRTTKKTIKKGLHARESLFSMKPKILFFIFSKNPFFFPLTKERSKAKIRNCPCVPKCKTVTQRVWG